MARRRARKSAARSGGQQGATAAAATSTKPHQSAPNHIDAVPSPRDESGRVRNEPARSQKTFPKENNAHDSESDEQSQSSSTTTDDEEVGNHASASGDVLENSKAKHIRILSVALSETITVEELNMDDMFDFNNVLMPSRIQDASSDDSDLSDSGSTRSSLAADFENLQCTEEGFKKYCKRRSLQSRRRWRRGGNHKRHHDQTVGSGEEFEDVTPLDPPTSNPSRRLRRRTGEPQEKPGRSQILGNFEELFGTVANVILQENASGDYDEYLLSQWTFDSMVIDEDSDGDAGDEDSGNEDSGEEDASEDSSDEDSSDEDSSDDDSSDDSSDSD
jgi:hypothetical protein